MRKRAATLLAIFAVSLAEAAHVNFRLTWDANQETNVFGYYVHYGGSPASFTNSVDAGKVVTIVVSNFDVGDYWFMATAYNQDRLQSNPSQNVYASVPKPVAGFKINR